MTASLQMTLARTILNLIREAVVQGLSATNPVKLKLLGSTMQGDLAAPERFVIISFAKPTVIDETQIWINPANRVAFKCDPFAHDWFPIHQFGDLFSAYNSVAGDDGAGGSNPSGSGGGAGQPVQALTDLQALPTGTTPDKTLIYVENERAIYAYDKTSIDNGPGVIVPATGVGRWLLVSNTSGGSLSLDGGMF